jgi:hypothetical protein
MPAAEQYTTARAQRQRRGGGGRLTARSERLWDLQTTRGSQPPALRIPRNGATMTPAWSTARPAIGARARHRLTGRLLSICILALGGSTVAVGLPNGMDNLPSALRAYPGGHARERLGLRRAPVSFNLVAAQLPDRHPLSLLVGGQLPPP